MLRYMFKRLRRTPVIAVALILFAAVVSSVLCGLHRDNLAEQAHYDRTWRSIPVTLTVTNLTGTQTDGLDAPAFVLDVFCPESLYYPNLSPYIRNLQWKLHHDIHSTGVPGFEEGILVGINTLSAEAALSPENGAQIFWLSGYDETIFAGEAQVCIVPQRMYQQLADTAQPLILEFQYRVPGLARVTETEIEVLVAGYYTGAGSDRLYGPARVLDGVYEALGEARVIDSVSGTLSDNERLEELKQKRQCWFAAPSATGAATVWGAYDYPSYPNALDIDDSLLRNAKNVLEGSIRINGLCAVAVLALSTAAGFFIGLSVIRSRRREMALLRSMGTPNASIFVGFALENLSCIAIGALLGGAGGRWQPAGQLALFVGIYALSLMVSLLIFMNGNLLAAIKEDE